MSDHNYFRHTGTTGETVISAGPCRIIRMIPSGTTLGTVTLRDSASLASSAVFYDTDLGMPQEGITFSEAGVRLNGLTIQLEETADEVVVIWAAKHN